MSRRITATSLFLGSGINAQHGVNSKAVVSLTGPQLMDAQIPPRGSALIDLRSREILGLHDILAGLHGRRPLNLAHDEAVPWRRPDPKLCGRRFVVPITEAVTKAGLVDDVLG